MNVSEDGIVETVKAEGPADFNRRPCMAGGMLPSNRRPSRSRDLSEIRNVLSQFAHARQVRPVNEPSRAGPTFEQVVLPHLDAVYNLARWLLRDPVVTEDVVQDACLRALQYFPSFRGGDGRAWLLQIVRNASYARLKTRRSGIEVPLDDDGGDADFGAELPDPGPNPEAALAKQQDLARLDRALAALPIELRECLVLCELEQLSYKEIARVTNVPIGTVMSRLWRARKMLMRP